MGILANIFICFTLSSTSIFTYQDIVFPKSDVQCCKTPSGEEGICVGLRKCPKAIIALRKGIMPYHCGFHRNDPIVCCLHELENSSGPLLGRISQEEVESPAINFLCGIRGTITVPNNNLNGPFLLRRKREQIFRITVSGGQDAVRNSWPWMALLGRKKGTSETFFCSAVVINNNFLITAAHCVLSIEKFFVRLGEHDYKNEFGESNPHLEEDVEVDSLLFHPKYDIKKGYHDIALIKLAKAVEFRDEVSPICLPWGRLSTEDLVNEIVTVAGWGKLSFGGIQSSVLQEVNVTVFEPSRCVESYSTLKTYDTSFPEGMTRENMVCAGDVNGVKDACQGDSGGPMMHYTSETNTYTIAGIVSKGFGCGLKEYPGLYAPIRNSETLQWIKDTAFSHG